MIRPCLLFLIRLYQLAISPLLGPHCRFHPSCSTYCMESLNAHGTRVGVWLGVRRLLKCHPFHPGGFDPVPFSVSISAPVGAGSPCDLERRGESPHEAAPTIERFAS